MSRPADAAVVAAVIRRDLTAVRRTKAVVIPMLVVPLILLVLLPLGIGLAVLAQDHPDVSVYIHRLPAAVSEPILALPYAERPIVLVSGYLLAPLFLIVPLMVAAVLAADAFAGEKERRTLETLLHLPVPDRQLFYAKVLGAFLPAVAISWTGFVAFAVVTNTVAWPVMHRVFVPTKLWLVVILWVGPAVAALGMGVMVRVSARVKTVQAANQLGGAVILPLIFLALGQSTGLLLVELPVAMAIGAVVWAVAAWLIVRGARRFTRDRLLAG